jgi:hypothetical protein
MLDVQHNYIASVKIAIQGCIITCSGCTFGNSNPATFKSNVLLMRNADPRNGVTPSPFNAQLNAYIIPGYSFGNASTLPTLLIVSGIVAINISN